MTDTTTRLLRTSEIASATGATFRQVDYWCRWGWVRPVVEANGSGTYRLFDPADIPRLRVLARIGRVSLFGLVTSGTATGPWTYEADGFRVTVEVTR